MSEKTLTLPFMTETAVGKEELSFSAELACVVCLAEWQRKKPGFLRDVSQKIESISKVYFPIWVLPANNLCLIVDGLKKSLYKFTFEEPTKTAALVEELKKNSFNPQKFMESLKSQARETKAFTSQVSLSFPGLVDDRELLSFFVTYFQSGTFQDKQQNEAIPPETNKKTATETSQEFIKCLRTIEADAKGVKYAIDALKEEVMFHLKATNSEIEQLNEKLDAETATLKPVVEKEVKKLTKKHDKTLATLQKSIERKTASLDKRREWYMRKLQIAEKRKDAVKEKMEAAKKEEERT